jgi:hypothetical protein
MAKRYDTDSSPWDDFNRTDPKERQKYLDKKLADANWKVKQIDKLVAFDRKARGLPLTREERRIVGDPRLPVRAAKGAVKAISNAKKRSERKRWEAREEQRLRAPDRPSGAPSTGAKAARSAAKTVGRGLGAAGAAAELAFPSKAEGRNSDLAAQKARIRGGSGKVKYSQSSRADAVKAIQRERARRKK